MAVPFETKEPAGYHRAGASLPVGVPCHVHTPHWRMTSSFSLVSTFLRPLHVRPASSASFTPLSLIFGFASYPSLSPSGARNGDAREPICEPERVRRRPSGAHGSPGSGPSDDTHGFREPSSPVGSNSDPVHRHAAPMPMTVEEACNGGMELLGLLQTCADHMQRGDTALAASTVAEMRQMVGRTGAPSGMPKAAAHFVDALDRRLRHPPNSVPVPDTAMEGRGEIDFYDHTNESIPHVRFAHLTANEAIWEALDGHDRVHIIDLNLMQDLQWSALIRAFARRPGGPPALRLMGISCPSPDGPGNPSEVGETLTQLPRSLGVEFAFRSIVTNNLEEVEGMVDVSPGEAIAVNSMMRLQRLVGDPEAAHQPIDSVLAWIHRLSPAIVTLVEQDAVHNASDFLVRFKEALSYYSCMFNQMVGGGQKQEAETMAAVEAYLRREIYNIVCCEEGARVVRDEPLGG